MEERRAVLLEKVTALPKVKQTRLRCSWGRALACKCEVLSLIPTHVKWDQERNGRRESAGEEALAVRITVRTLTTPSPSQVEA